MCEMVQPMQNPLQHSAAPSGGPRLANESAELHAEPGLESFSFGFDRSLISVEQAERTSAVNLGEFVDPEASALFAAWCGLLFRYCDQEEFEVEVLGQADGEWRGHLARVSVSAESTCASLVAAAGTWFARPSAGRYPAGLRERQELGFSYEAANALTAASKGERSRSFPAAILCRQLHLVCNVQDSHVQCTLAYDRSRFRADAVRQLAEQFEVLISRLGATSELPLLALPLLNDVQRDALRRSWMGPQSAPRFEPVFRPIERHAAERPNAVAVALNAQTQTFLELDRAANKVAHWLLARGITPGATVAVCMNPCMEFMACLLGILKAGGTHVPLEPSYPPDRLLVMVEDTRPLVVLTQASVAGLLAHLSNADSSTAHRVPVVAVETLAAELGALPDSAPNVVLEPDQVAYIVYTSGTTGKPKGVMVTHANLQHYIAEARSAYGYNPSDVIPALARYTFSITFFELLGPLTAGARLVLLERAHVLDMPAMVRTLQSITCIHASPSLWRKLIAHIDEQKLAPAAFDNLRHVSSGGDMVPPDVLESMKRIFTRAEVFVIYGCSEISCMGCTYPVPRDRTLKSTRVGKPFPNMAIRLIDSYGNIVPPGLVGEVCFAGAGLAKGYLNSPELAAKKFPVVAGERLYHTGDVGRVDPEGNLELVGRSDFQIKLRGIRIEPAEVEATLRGLRGVKDAVVAAPTLQDGEKRLVAYVVLDLNAAPSAKEMRSFLKGKLPDYMVPAAFVVLEALPVNVNQKVDRLALARSMPAHYKPELTSDPPRTALERRLVEVWERVLDVKGIGIQDEFFEVGGDSLRSVALMVEIDKALGIALPVSTLLTEATIEQLARWIESGRRADSQAAPVVCLRKGDESRPAVFLIHDGDGESMPYRNLALALDPGHSVYGIHPKATRHHPMLHTRLADMVDYYIEQIRGIQSTGPYLLGGLCIGGFLAFEVARKLKAMGHEVGPVALLDVAHVKARPKSVTARRVGRLSGAIKDVASGGATQRALAAARLVVQRVQNVVRYEARTRFNRRATRWKILALRYCLDEGLTPPPQLRDISVDSILRFAEKEYVVPVPYTGEVVLVRATRCDPALDGIVDDTPYIDLFEEPLLGWADKATRFVSYEVPAGHSSMLRAPCASQVAALLQKHIDRALAPSSSRRG
jgi:amino acid adenylation domain-containing protein